MSYIIRDISISSKYLLSYTKYFLRFAIHNKKRKGIFTTELCIKKKRILAQTLVSGPVTKSHECPTIPYLLQPKLI